MHVLLDANVPLNTWLQGVMERPMVKESGLVMAMAAEERFAAYITPSILSNTFYFLRKHLGQPTAILLTEDLLDQTAIIPQDEHSFRKALRSGWPDVEDAALYFAALMEPRISLLCTTNTKHFKEAVGIKVVSPAQLLKLL
jgi:hypothetical protein